MKSQELYRTIQAHYLNELEKLRAQLRTLADVMADFADQPQDIAFKHAAKMYKKTKAELEEAEDVAKALADEIAVIPRIIVTVSGGLVEAVYCDHTAAVDVVDYDCCKVDAEYQENVSGIVCELGSRKDLAQLW